MTQSDSLTEILLRALMTTPNNMQEKTINGKTLNVFEVQNYRIIAQALQAHIDKLLVEARLGLIDYYDQAPNNESCNWKGLLADNRKQLEYELNQLKEKS